MKKILITLLLIFPISTYAYAPIFSSDLIIGKIESVIDSDGLKIRLESFVNYRIINELSVIMRRNIPVNNYMTIEHYPSDIDIQSWDIVAIESSWDTYSYGIFKITCSKDSTSQVIWTVDKLFWTDPDDSFQYGIDLANKIDATIWCENLASFLETDRRLQDLDGEHAIFDFYKQLALKSYIEIFIIFSIITWTVWAIIYTKKKKLNK